MAKIADAVQNGIEHSRAGRKRRMLKRKTTGKATPSGLFLVFKDAMEKHEYGAPKLLTKQEFNMLSGFIKVSLNNSMEDSWIYAIIETVVSKWDRLKRMPLLTRNNKSWVASDRPSLRDFLVCRDSFLDNIELLSREQNVKDNKLTADTSITSVRLRKGPTDDELGSEYEQLLGALDE